MNTEFNYTVDRRSSPDKAKLVFHFDSNSSEHHISIFSALGTFFLGMKSGDIAIFKDKNTSSIIKIEQIIKQNQANEISS